MHSNNDQHYSSLSARLVISILTGVLSDLLRLIKPLWLVGKRVGGGGAGDVGWCTCVWLCPANPSGALNGGKCAAVGLQGFCCTPHGGGRQLGDAGGAKEKKKHTKEKQNPDPDRPFAQNIARLALFHFPPQLKSHCLSH